jgi:plastocyanin
VMLHHVVFINAGAPGRPPELTSCPGRKGQPFWGSGEEKQRLILPPGYGYRIRRDDRWRMETMLMSHGIDGHRLRVEYRFTVVTGRRMQRVRPLWLRANGCDGSSYDVPGDDRPSSLHTRSHDWRMPLTGRIVASGAHTHAGHVAVDISQNRCEGRRLIRHEPRYGAPDDPVYRIRPVLHEPGPVAVGHFLSSTGIPVVKGERLRVTGIYEGQWPRPAVMAIPHVYIAPDRRVRRDCAPPPADERYVWTRDGGRPSAPRMALGFNVWDPRLGRTREIPRPRGRLVDAGRRATVKVLDNRFAPANLAVDRGAVVRWRWLGRERHNVWYADGPRLVLHSGGTRGQTMTRTLTTPGRYRLFCYLHPLTMHQQIDVR